MPVSVLHSKEREGCVLQKTSGKLQLLRRLHLQAAGPAQLFLLHKPDAGGVMTNSSWSLCRPTERYIGESLNAALDALNYSTDWQQQKWDSKP